MPQHAVLRSKLYALIYEDSTELVKMKGTPSSCFEQNNIMFENYCNCLNEIPLPKSEFYRIGSKSHKVFKFLQKKLLLYRHSMINGTCSLVASIVFHMVQFMRQKIFKTLSILYIKKINYLYV